MRRPRLPDELCERINAARGDVSFDRYVRGLIEIGLRTVKAHEGVTPPPSVEAELPARKSDKPYPTERVEPGYRIPLSETWRR
jgi:hypothetical protein